jgi:hypothetical protein
MNWQEIINKSELVYASTPDDKGFRTWSLKKTTCDVSFYESYPIEDIDKIICSILEKAGGTLAEENLATILGFNIVDNFDVTPKRYADKAEFDIFRAIGKPVFDWGLVTKEKKTNTYQLTELGRRALEKKEKHKFYTGQKILFENFNVKPAELPENRLFPFYSALGIYFDIINTKFIPYNKVILCENFDFFETELIKRHKLQSKDNYQIYKSEITKYFEFGSCQVDIRLFKQGNEYYPVIYYNNQICVEATELLYMPENIKEKEKKIEWGLYLKLIKDPDTELDYKTIIPFEDLLELDSLIKDSRLVWSDNQLFEFITQNTDANQWFTISNHCPIDVIKIHIDGYKDKWDWTSLSLRIDDDFLIQNATNYLWNFEAISAKENISIEVIKTLLLIPELKEQEWDWDSIMPQLNFEFIKTNIDRIDFELSELTISTINEVQPLITQYPDKRWDWSYISAEYELPFILDNILRFREYLQIKKVINRAFTSNEYVELFYTSDNFKTVLAESKETVLRDYSPNQENYVWSDKLIDLLEEPQYLVWESGTYKSGFECNPHIEWSYEHFNKYHSKIATEKGYSFVSQKIKDSNTVLDFPDFNWDWNTISTNTNLIYNKEFVLTVAGKLNLALLLQIIDNEILEALFEKYGLLPFLENNPESWQPVTEKSSIEFVRNHIGYHWDWAILTKRFCSSIKVEVLGNPKWIDKWDWKYLTHNLDFSKIYDNLDLYVDYWDWEYLTEKLDKGFILNNLLDYNEYLAWNILLNVRLDKSDLLFSTHLLNVATCISDLNDDLQKGLWQIITRKFDYAELETIIAQSNQSESSDLFQWDYVYFYDLPAFNVRQYLNKHSDLIDWSVLSCSKTLNKTLKWDKSLFSYDVWLKDVLKLIKNDSFQWDFKYLSRLDSINWNDTILKVQTKKWDWDYLSEYSGCFKKGKEFSKKIKKFSDYINYQIFSKRTDSDIAEKLLSETLDKNWDWSALSENKSVKLLIAFVKQNKDKQWNWEALSLRNDIKIDKETLIELSEKEWNWEAISKRTDISFDEDIIRQLNNKPLDWMTVSQNQSFIPTSITLSLLKGKSLDWCAISQNKNLPIEILWDYRDYLNWQTVTRNEKFDISDLDQLEKYQDFVDWKFVSQSDKFKISINNLKQFKSKLNWSALNQRNDFKVSEEMLDPFVDVLNWSEVSKSMEISFSEDLIEKYRDKWDWQLLRKNSQIIEKLDTTLTKYKAEFNCVDFLERFNRKPYIYHFTHLFNAIDIIKSRKILSRNKAEGNFANAAGNLVARRSTAHNFARFYFRPQTPTQFYNECLGWDTMLTTSWGKSYYETARRMDLPKCPIPVFFKFDLKEVFMKMAEKCYHSTGNMQTDRARVVKITDNPNLLQMNYLFDNISDAFSMAGGPYNYDRQLHLSIMGEIKEYSQQEFLVEEEFDFSTLDSFEIICYNEEYANLLKAQLGNDSICEKINSTGWDIFHRDNRKLIINETDTEVSIYSEYKDNAYLAIKGQGLQNIQILNPENVQRETANEILAYPQIRFTKTDKPIEVHFVDLAIDKRDWLVYKN